MVPDALVSLGIWPMGRHRTAGVGVTPSLRATRGRAEGFAGAGEDPTDAIASGPHHREYYDLVHDPFELSNLFEDGIKGDEPNVKMLHARLGALRHCIGSACR